MALWKEGRKGAAVGGGGAGGGGGGGAAVGGAGGGGNNLKVAREKSVVCSSLFIQQRFVK
jgi:hypothetical protein